VLNRADILGLIPHQGAMCLLDGVTGWTAQDITCHSASHLDPANPLRRDGQLAPICGVEYGLQAAAVHGALCNGAPQQAGFVAALRRLEMHVDRLDDPAFGVLAVSATLEHADSTGMIYAFRLTSASGRCLLAGRGVVAFPR
jgi:predicted hotdog family 3-hydroxylacyl-ACP dehydratase